MAGLCKKHGDWQGNQKRCPACQKEYGRMKYEKNRESILADNAQRAAAKDPELVKAYQAAYRKENDARLRAQRAEYLRVNHDRIRRRAAEYTSELKADVVAHYGNGRCCCCGEDEIRFLTVDHINNDGNVHRKAVKTRGSRFYLWLRKNGFPEGFQILCYNCNCAKHTNGGTCPHEEAAA